MNEWTITGQFLQLANDEGKQAAIEQAQELQTALECLVEIGSKEQQRHALFLLAAVNDTIITLLQLR